jgi:ArsR family transcriptional regulator, arsenate/arsenite/antimonite-responsive transcriptional repressor / arsenate reductase (thioredoxin)
VTRSPAPVTASTRRRPGAPGSALATAAIDPGAIDAAGRRQLPLPRLRPRSVGDVRHDGDLVVTVCDLAHEELGGLAAVHWSVPDPVPVGDQESFDAALGELDRRVALLAPRVAAS